MQQLNAFEQEVYVLGDVQAQATVFRVPLEITGLYSTENGTGIGPANQLGFSLNKEAVKSAALQWLEERLSPKTLFDSTEAARADYYRSTLRDKRFPQYQTWREQRRSSFSVTMGFKPIVTEKDGESSAQQTQKILTIATFDVLVAQTGETLVVNKAHFPGDFFDAANF